jgi:putative transposase
MYEWRDMTGEKRREVLKLRRQCRVPLHSPPHYSVEGWNRYHLSAANYEHVPIIGKTPERMASFSAALGDLFCEQNNALFAWCVLPNHWHAIIGTTDLKAVLKRVARLHGKSSFEWNGEDHARGRQCWHCCADRRIRSEEHFQAARNYVHNNPVKHGYVQKWDDWPFSSASLFIDEVGREEAARLWKEFPVMDMGKKWDKG